MRLSPLATRTRPPGRRTSLVRRLDDTARGTRAPRLPWHRARWGRAALALALVLTAACASERTSTGSTASALPVVDARADPTRGPVALAGPVVLPPPALPPPPSMYTGPSGEDIDDLCGQYADAKADIEFRRRRRSDARRCRRVLQARSRAERQAIADCANLCNESGGYVECFDGFGTPEFPACEPADLDDTDE